MKDLKSKIEELKDMVVRINRVKEENSRLFLVKRAFDELKELINVFQKNLVNMDKETILSNLDDVEALRDMLSFYTHDLAVELYDVGLTDLKKVEDAVRA